MKGANWLLASLVGLGLLASQEAAPAVTQPIVQTRDGALAGLVVDGVDLFRGIPFAQPPVGDLRWRPPQPVMAWSGVRDATQWGHICMQPPPQDPRAVGATTPNEDCLTLNVWAPEGARSQRLPVMVWIHGGGFVLGSGIGAQSDGSALARQGVIVVSLNYRLGKLGFFAHPALTAESHGGDLANYGLMDQIAALKWVRDNIAAFGGDPQNVTIFGGSAGGESVLALMTSPAAHGLFQKAICQSGPARDRAQTLTEAEAAGVSLAARWGVKDASVQALRAVPAERILADSADANVATMSGEMPLIDGRILPSQIVRTFEAGGEAPVPLVIGTTDYELPPQVVPPQLQARVRPYAVAGPVLNRLYPSEAAYAHYLSDAIFAEPARYLASLHARHAPTFRYRFSAFPDALRALGFTGAVHSTEGGYVFKTFSASAWPMTDADQALAEQVSAYWVAFAKTGDPNHAGLPTWPRAGGAEILNFTHQGPAPMHDDREALLVGLSEAYAHGDLPLVMGVDAKAATAR